MRTENEKDSISILQKEREEFYRRIHKFNKISYILISLNFGLSSLSDLSIQYFCKDYLKLQPSEFSRYITFTQIPWIMKPLFGLLTDSCPIFGTRRKFYIILCGFIGFLSWFLIAFYASSLFYLIMFLTLMNTGLSFASVLGEAIVVELSQLKIETKNQPQKDNNSTENGLKYKFLNEMKEVSNPDIIKEDNKAEYILKYENQKTSVELEKEIDKNLFIKNTNNQSDKDNSNDSHAKDFISLFFFFKYIGAFVSSLLTGHLIKLFRPQIIFLISGFLSILTVISGIIFIENKFTRLSNGNEEGEECKNDNSLNINQIFSPSSNNKEDISDNFKYNKLKEETLITTNFEKNNWNQINQKITNSEEKNKVSSINKDETNYNFNDDSLENNNKNNRNLEIKKTNKHQEKASIKNHIKIIFKFLFQKYILIPTFFLIIYMSTPSYDDPIFYFFTEELKLTSVDLGNVSACSMIFNLIGIIIYKMKLKKYSFRSMIIGCSLVSFVFSFMSYILTKRYNVLLGIPDMFLIIFSTSINSLLGELSVMPMLSLACLLSPKNLEGTAYSIFMSAMNFGYGLSVIFGSFLTQYMKITSKDFKNLPNLILISNILFIVPLPLICIIKNSYFSPESNNNENESENKIKNESSIELAMGIEMELSQKHQRNI